MITITLNETAETLIILANIFECSLDEAWENLIHDCIKAQIKKEDVMKYIEDNHIKYVLAEEIQEGKIKEVKK